MNLSIMTHFPTMTPNPCSYTQTHERLWWWGFLLFPEKDGNSTPMVAPITILKPLFAATTRKAISYP
jgi:hypothetical protein